MKKYLIAALLTLTVACGLQQKEEEQKSWLFVMHSKGNHISSNRLILNEPYPLVLAFTDRPYRLSASLDQKKFIENWSRIFVDHNPNADLSYFDQEGRYHGLPVELSDPQWQEGEISFDIRPLDGRSISGMNHSNETALFISGGHDISMKEKVMQLHHEAMMGEPKCENKKCTK